MTYAVLLRRGRGGQKVQGGGQTIGPPVGPNLRSYLALTYSWATTVDYPKACCVT